MQLSDRMKGLAFIQVRAAREADGGLLDFSRDSLGALDRLIDRDVSQRPLDPDALSEVIGAYLGETLCRRLGATWEETVAGPRLRLGGLVLDPLARARLRVTQGKRRSLERYFAEVERARARGRVGEGLEDA
jgi:hypothetical protein